MKQLKIGITWMMLLFFSTAFSQNKQHRLPPPPPPVPEIKVVQPVPPEKAILPELSLPPAPPTPPVPPVPPPPPPPKVISGHPWTRNGENVWVVKPLELTKPVIPTPPKKSL